MKNGSARSCGYAVPTPAGICLVESTTVAGTKHVPNIRGIAEGLKIGSRLVLEREASNRLDKNAVRVKISAGGSLGYLSCEFNDIVSRLIDGGKHLHAVVRSVAFVDSWTKIEMAVILDD